MSSNLSWTSALGDAYFNVPQSVMNAVQVMRQRAYQAGNLKNDSTTECQRSEPGARDSTPAGGIFGCTSGHCGSASAADHRHPTCAARRCLRSDLQSHRRLWSSGAGVSRVCLPPTRPVHMVATGLISFGVGMAIGAAISNNNGCCGWGYNSWGCGWNNSSVTYNRNVYVSNSNTFVNRNNYYNRNNINNANINRNNVNTNNVNRNNVNNNYRANNFDSNARNSNFTTPKFNQNGNQPSSNNRPNQPKTTTESAQNNRGNLAQNNGQQPGRGNQPNFNQQNRPAANQQNRPVPARIRTVPATRISPRKRRGTRLRSATESRRQQQRLWQLQPGWQRPHQQCSRATESAGKSPAAAVRRRRKSRPDIHRWSKSRGRRRFTATTATAIASAGAGAPGRRQAAIVSRSYQFRLNAGEGSRAT